MRNLMENPNTNLVASRSYFLQSGDSLKVFKEAVGGNAAAVGFVVKKSEKTIYKMFTDLAFCVYSRFLKYFYAIYEKNPSGGELLFEDFRARVHALRFEQFGDVTDQEWFEQVAECEREHSEGIRAAILSRDPSAIRTQITEDIVAKRRLLVMLRGREAKGKIGA